MLNLGIVVLALRLGNGAAPQPTPSLVEQTANSGRAATVAESVDKRVEIRRQIAPGPPPELSFRLYEGKSHHRYDNSGLMLDDAGH
ncbi:MAG TPA: hypothetical protein VHZ07_19645 [Bryobacteraceae bacterium]|jgi:hypothetical protein|nr:hypothetical protein [Bryobacteraceae bacterium]